VRVFCVECFFVGSTYVNELLISGIFYMAVLLPHLCWV